jgi:hypothetical protein
MSHQRARHLKRQPTEDAIRLVSTDFVAAAGTVDVQRMSYDWRADDVLIHIEADFRPMVGTARPARATPVMASALAIIITHMNPFARETFASAIMPPAIASAALVQSDVLSCRAAECRPRSSGKDSRRVKTDSVGLPMPMPKPATAQPTRNVHGGIAATRQVVTAQPPALVLRGHS